MTCNCKIDQARFNTEVKVCKYCDSDKFNAFMTVLDAPPVPNDALNRLLHTAAPWD